MGNFGGVWGVIFGGFLEAFWKVFNTVWEVFKGFLGDLV